MNKHLLILLHQNMEKMALFQLPEGFSVDTIEISGEEIKKYIYNPAALDFLMRIIPHVDSRMVGKSTRAPTDNELIYSLPANGPNCVGQSSYIGHANEDQSYNVKLSNTLDSSGYLAMETTRVIEKGEELLVQHDKDLLKHHHAFVKSAMNALQDPNASVNKEAIKKNVNEIEDEDEQKKHLIENFNEFYLKLAVSSIHGVGVVVADHPGAVIQPGSNPFYLPRGYSGYETIDLTRQQLEQLITSPAGKDFVLKYCNPSKNEDGLMLYPAPTCGANGIDLSYFVNSAKGTGRSCNLVLGEGRDARGLTPLVFNDGVDMSMSVGDELLTNYTPAIEGIDWNNKNPFIRLLAAVLEAVGLRFILQEAIAKAKKVIIGRTRSRVRSSST